MTKMAFQIISLTVVYPIVYSDADQRKHQSSASLALCGEFTGSRWKFPAQRASNAENVSIWWRHHVLPPPWSCRSIDKSWISQNQFLGKIRTCAFWSQVLNGRFTNDFRENFCSHITLINALRINNVVTSRVNAGLLKKLHAVANNVRLFFLLSKKGVFDKRRNTCDWRTLFLTHWSWRMFPTFADAFFCERSFPCDDWIIIHFHHWLFSRW